MVVELSRSLFCHHFSHELRNLIDLSLVTRIFQEIAATISPSAEGSGSWWGGTDRNPGAGIAGSDKQKSQSQRVPNMAFKNLED